MIIFTILKTLDGPKRKKKKKKEINKPEAIFNTAYNMFPASNAQAIQSQGDSDKKKIYKCVTLNTNPLITVKCNLKMNVRF